MGGSSTNVFWRLDISGSDLLNSEWEVLESWPGPPRAFAVGVGQGNGVENCFYLFSGRNVQEGKEVEILKDAFVFNPLIKSWEKIGTELEFPVMAGTGFSLGASGIVFSSGAEGNLMLKANQLRKRIDQIATSPDYDELTYSIMNTANRLYL